MVEGIVFLFGILVGGLLVHFGMRQAHERVARFDEHYVAARLSALRHLRVHGTLNLMQMQHLMDINTQTALHYLRRLEHDGIIKQQGNDNTAGIFYTAA